MRHRVSAALRGKVLSTGALVALLLATAPVVLAAEPLAAARHLIEQPSQALAKSLRAIARQTGVSVLFDPGVVQGRVAKAVSGRLSAAEAIGRALEGSGLVADVMRDGAIVVKPAAAPAGTAPAASPRSPVVGAEVPPARGESAPVRLAQAPTQPGAAVGGPAPAEGGERTASVQRIEVTGSRLRRVTAEGPVPVNTYSREEIERSGQPTLERFLSSLNEASVSQGEGSFGQTTGQATIQLRGLPVGSTLVLVNGRRVQAVGSSSGNFFNLNLIPMAAVERVEVVPVGSSAVYGGDALVGVVNVILKKSIDGVSLDARLAGASGTEDGGISLSAGRRSEEGSWLLLGSYRKATPLTQSERSFFNDADYRRLGGPDTRARNCTPGTVTSTTGTNLPGLGATEAGIPTTADGTPLTPASFLPTAGQPNLCNTFSRGKGAALVHGAEQLALHAMGERMISTDWSLFGELTYVDDRLQAEEGGIALNSVLVPASNRYNPFGVPVRVTSRLGPENGATGFERDTRYARVLAGLRGQLTAEWDAEATISLSRDDGQRRRLNADVNVAARNAALASAVEGEALNPFATGRAATDDVLGRIWTHNVRGNHGRKEQVTAFARGPLFELPAGPVEALIGAESARDTYSTQITGDVSITDSRRAHAAFGELRLPLLRAGEGASGWTAAALSVAARHDKYSDFGVASTYQAGLEFRPARTALIRASAATSFKPPTLVQTNVDDATFDIEEFSLVDPARGNEAVTGGQVLRTTNPSLGPEEGKAFAMGVVWEPQGWEGSRFGVNAWQVKIDGLIALLWPQITVNNEAQFPGFVTRGPSVGGVPGPIERVLWAEVNFGRVQTSGIDFEASHGWRALGGRWDLGASATWTRRYDVVIAPGAPKQSRVGKRFADYWAPEWKGRVSLGYSAGAWQLGMTNRYIGSYEDAGTSSRKLGGSWVHDIAGGLDLRRLGLSMAGIKRASLSASILNVLDRKPEFVGTSPYYDVTQADWRGRYLSVRLSADW